MSTRLPSSISLNLPPYQPFLPSLNLNAPPYIPPSTVLPLPEITKKSKATKKKTIPVSPTSFQKEQTILELGMVRTKLKQTETELKDLKDVNEILTARNKLFEGKRINDAYEKLFTNETEKSIPSAITFILKETGVP